MNARRARRITSLWGLALFGLPALMVEASAESVDNAGVRHEALAANLELLLSSPIRPYSAGLFFNHRIAPGSRYHGALNLGGLFRYRADRHRLGIEVTGLFEDPDESTLMLGYYGTISRTVSFRFVVDAKINAGQEQVVRTELVWRINWR